jgi:hypothetical protein
MPMRSLITKTEQEKKGDWKEELDACISSKNRTMTSENEHERYLYMKLRLAPAVVPLSNGQSCLTSYIATSCAVNQACLPVLLVVPSNHASLLLHLLIVLP